MKRLGALFLMVTGVTAGTAHAATYYASTSGSDGFSCSQAQSISSPKRTIRSGLTCLAAGDTLLIRAGTYNESIENGIASGTSWSNKVRIANYPSETVWLTGGIWLYNGLQSYIEFDGINIDASAREVATYFGNDQGNLPHHIRIQNAEIIAGWGSNAGSGVNVGAHVVGGLGGFELINLKIHGIASTPTYGIYIMAKDSLVENCDIYTMGVAGIHIYNGGGGDNPSGNIIRNNRIHDLHLGFGPDGPSSAIWGVLVAGNNTQIYNNVFYDTTATFGHPGNAAVNVYSGSGTKVWNNTIYGNNHGGVYIGPNGSNTEIRNNIIYGNQFTIKNDGGALTESNNLFVDPLFVNPSAKDFQLGTSSRAVDAGVGLAAVTTDIVGTARPLGAAPDIGAFEYRGQDSSTVSPPSPPTNVRIVASN